MLGCYGNASTQNQIQKWVWVRFLLFSRIIGNPSKTKKCWGISEYFGPVSAIFTFDLFPVFLFRFLFFWVCFRFSVKVLNSQFIDRFPLFWVGFLFFWVHFLFFWVHFRFSVKVLNSQFIDRFPLFLSLFPVFKKSFKLLKNWDLKLFLKTGNGPKKWGTDPKNGEMDTKKEETNQQTENLKLFLKTGNRPQKWGKRSTNWEFITFLKTGNFFLKIRNGPKIKEETDPKKRKPINKMWFYNFFWKPETDPKNEDTDRKYCEIPQKYKTGVNRNLT